MHGAILQKSFLRLLPQLMSVIMEKALVCVGSEHDITYFKEKVDNDRYFWRETVLEPLYLAGTQQNG